MNIGRKSGESSVAPYLSYVTLPRVESPCPSILDFLDRRFDKVGRDVWRSRIEKGCVKDDSGLPISLDTPYRVNLRLSYRREVDTEPVIPFKEEIVFRNEHFLVADKPHFLPVIPSGPYVNECLLYRLGKSTGIEGLVPINRLDRETAGLVMFSVCRETRNIYSDLFRLGRITKTYEAIGVLPPEPGRKEWFVESRITRGEPWFLSRNEEGKPNARTVIRLAEAGNGKGFFVLKPLTGKQHQLRLHMTMIGSRILNDFYYPVLQPEPKEGFDKPLQLLARELSFIDPLGGIERKILSKQTLEW